MESVPRFEVDFSLSDVLSGNGNHAGGVATYIDGMASIRQDCAAFQFYAGQNQGLALFDCAEPSHFICQLDPEISGERKPFVPTPMGIWPLSETRPTTDILEDEIEAVAGGGRLALDPMTPPTGFAGRY